MDKQILKEMLISQTRFFSEMKGRFLWTLVTLLRLQRVTSILTVSLREIRVGERN